MQPPQTPTAAHAPAPAAADGSGKPRPPLLPDDSLEHVLSAPYHELVALAASNRTTVALPRLVMWYGEDFGRSLPQRVLRMKGMLEAGVDDVHAWATGGAGGGVCKIGERRYAHAVLTGLLQSYAQQATCGAGTNTTAMAKAVDARVRYNAYNWGSNAV